MNPNFTPLASALGGILIGLSAASMLALNGRIAGISGIVGGLVDSRAEDRSWRGTFVIGMLLARHSILTRWMLKPPGSSSRGGKTGSIKGFRHPAVVLPIFPCKGA